MAIMIEESFRLVFNFMINWNFAIEFNFIATGKVRQINLINLMVYSFNSLGNY